MTLKEIEELAGHRKVSPWVVKLVGDAVAKEREREWVGLTDEETNSVIDEVKESQHSFDDISFAIAIAIEKALKDKNT